MQSELSNTITNLRVVATIVIVLYHCTCPYYPWRWGGYLGDYPVVSVIDTIFLKLLSDIMLPTFFMLSGILFYWKQQSYSNTIQAIWKKFDRLVIPMALITMVCTWLKTIGLNDSADGHLWFLEVLFLYFCMSITLSRIPAKYHIILGILMFGAYKAMSSKTGMEYNPTICRFLKYYIFFTGGYYISTYYEQLRKNTILKYGILIILIVSALVNKQSVYIIFFNLALVSWTSNAEVKSKVWKRLNTNSFSIYLLHHPIIFALFYNTPFFQQLYAHEATLSILLMFIVAFSVSWALAEGLHKIGFKYF